MFTRILISLVVGFFYLNSTVLAQPQKITLGISAGSNLIQPDLEYFLLNSPILVAFPKMQKLTPTHFNLMVNYPLGRSVFWRIAAGYGFSRVYRKTGSNIVNPNNEIEYRLSGYPLETAIVLEKPLTAKDNVTYKLGIIAGYYHYKFHEKLVDSALGGRFNIDKTTSKLSGVAQSILVGTDIKLSRSSFVSFELTKPVFSFLENIYDVYATISLRPEEATAEPIAKIKSSYPVQNGLNDLGITMGFHIQL
jgi:hypothetical protein